jgi:hypothetical protein
MSTGAPNETGTPIRMPSTALLCVDSADGTRYNAQGYVTGDNKPSDIYINKQAPLMFGYMTRISLTEVNLNWSTPNVNERNNTLTFRVADASGTVTDPARIKGTFRIAIPEMFRLPGNDTGGAAGSISQIVQTTLNNFTISGFTNIFDVRFFPQFSQFVIGISGANPASGVLFLSILPPGQSYDITSVSPANTFTGKVDDDLTYMMGLTPRADTQNYFTDTILGSYASCQYTPYVDIISTILTKNQNVRDNDSSLRNGSAKLARVYLSQPGVNNQFDIDEDGVINTCNIVGVRPFTIHREFENPKVISWNTTENVDIVDLRVVDRLGYPLYIQENIIDKSKDQVYIGNTAAFQFTLQITEV